MYVKVYSLISDEYCDRICNMLLTCTKVKPPIKPSLYQCVFKGSLKCKTLDDVREYFYEHIKPPFYTKPLEDADIIVTPTGAYGLAYDMFFRVEFNESKVYRNPND